MSKLPRQPGADRLLHVKVEEIGAQSGGIAGLHHLYVKVSGGD